MPAFIAAARPSLAPSWRHRCSEYSGPALRVAFEPSCRFPVVVAAALWSCHPSSTEFHWSRSGKRLPSAMIYSNMSSI